ncbi:nucleotidyltransferase domain-containing protein [Candidatus Parcubacteria bacterium]|nr:MAG: nucleotidyltransferase domain-containing protein [Candidatus Parcubacteria bacterium]
MMENVLALLSEDEQTAIRTYIQEIRKQFPDEILSVALFGSKARGDDDPESDIDLLVITNSESYDLRSALWQMASEISLNFDVLISAHIFSQERWERTCQIGLPFPRAIAADHIPLAL